MSHQWLALDVASNCGWAHDSGPSGLWCFSAELRLYRFYCRLNLIEKQYGVGRIVYESAVSYARRGGFQVEMEMHGVMKLWCEERRITPVGVNPTSLKKWATGDGKASKAQMVIAARRMFPDRTIASDDEADALMLLLYAWRELT